jgi:hypothetical protein
VTSSVGDADSLKALDLNPPNREEPQGARNHEFFNRIGAELPFTVDHANKSTGSWATTNSELDTVCSRRRAAARLPLLELGDERRQRA